MLRHSLHTALLALSCAALFAACGDDDDVATDGSVRADATANPDAGAGRPDAVTTPDGGGEGARFTAALSAAQEVPPSDSSAMGSLEITIEGDTVRYTLTHDVPGATAAHLHRGIAGQNGPVAVAFPNADGNQSGTLTLSASDRADLEAGRLYANVHNAAFPGGAIRGQVLLPGETLRVAHLEGAQETPPVVGTSTGTAQLAIAADGVTVRYLLDFDVTATAMHIHRGPAGVAGGVVVPLEAGGGTVTLPSATELTRNLLYVNVHTAANPNGELRGQILEPGAQLFAGHLTPAQEVPPVAGATSEGRAQVVLDALGRSVAVYVTHNATVTAAHVHEAPGGLTGPVRIPLEASNQISSSHAVTATQAERLERGVWYVNVHTAANPNGEIRGQLLRPGEWLFTAMMSGAQEVPPVATAATGGLGVIVSSDRRSFRYDGSVAGIAPTDAHIHDGAVGMNGPVVFPLMLTGTSMTGTSSITEAQLADLEAGGYYANVHTAANPGGEVRGQLMLQP